MTTRSLLAGLIVLATIGFVVGVSIEKADDHHEAPSSSVTESSEASEEAGHTEAEEGAEQAEGEEGPSGEDGEFKPLGVNLESTPLIVLAALGSLALAAAAWVRPRWRALLGVMFGAMAAFGALDLAEAIRKADSEPGLAILASIVAALHFGAAFVALQMARDVRT